ncbi:MarP family serine protease [Actinopolymorpha cephalotaxi]|nr:MarP family serine protease [Actinopolymorpha cephalotaxi]
MGLNALDLILIVAAICYGISGYRQGFLIGALGVAGLIGGGVAGAWLAPIVLDKYEPGMRVSLVALGIVLAGAFLGQALGAALGAALRSHVTWRPAHLVDATAGAALSVAAMLVVAWILGSAVANARFGDISTTVRSSKVLATVDEIVPPFGSQAVQAFGRVVDPSLFPRYLAPFEAERIAPAQPPAAGVLRDPDIVRAGRSVVRVTGVALECSRSLEGSGFVYAPGRVMTNAHVVAGVSAPRVETREGRRYDARVVSYDPERDVAVLAVPDLPLDPVPLDEGAKPGDEGAVLGYPGNGPFTAGAARVRSEQPLRGPDIYGDQQVTRDVFSLYAKVRPGNSGGPLISPEGTATGLVFAASVEDGSTGYALTAQEVAGNARAGVNATEPVSTGGCS